jgi:hypothetical protein
MLKISLTNDARMTVGAAAIVWRIKAINPKCAYASLRKLIQDRTSYATDAEDDYVVFLHCDQWTGSKTR